MTMFRKTLFIAAALTFSAFGFQAGNIYNCAMASTAQKTTKETRNVDNFNAVAVIGNYDIVYTQGKTHKVEVEAPSNIMDKITTEVKKGTLTISTKKIAGVRVITNTNIGNDVTVYVTSPTITEAVLMGSGDFVSSTAITADKLRIALLGSGDMSFSSISCNTLNASINGSGDISLKKVQATQAAKIALNGSGDFNIDNVSTANANVALNGSGDLNIISLDSPTTNMALNGSGDMKATTIKTKNANASMHGNGDISLHFSQCESLNSTVIGNGNMMLSGTTDIYRKSESTKGSINDSKLHYKQLVNAKSNAYTISSPISPGAIEAQP